MTELQIYKELDKARADLMGLEPVLSAQVALPSGKHAILGWLVNGEQCNQDVAEAIMDIAATEVWKSEELGVNGHLVTLCRRQWHGMTRAWEAYHPKFGKYLAPTIREAVTRALKWRLCEST